MKCVLLAGGLGTRISEETHLRPKPMISIGGRPMLWHIMKLYSAHGVNDFIICCGYKGHVIKQFFRDYDLDGADVRFDMREGQTTVLRALAFEERQQRRAGRVEEVAQQVDVTAIGDRGHLDAGHKTDASGGRLDTHFGKSRDRVVIGHAHCRDASRSHARHQLRR